MTVTTQPDLTRNLFVLLFVLGLMLACAYILQPFVLAGIWAVTVVAATWPILTWLQARLRNRRGPAVAVMVGVLLLVVLVPLLILVVGVARNSDRLESLPQAIGQFTVPPPPDFVADIPLVGPKIAAAWTDFAAQGGEKLAATAQSHAAEATQWLVKRLGGFTRLLVQILLMIVIAAVLYARGEQAARGLLLFARRLGGERGENAVILAGQTVRAVALGVIVTAVAQTMLAGLGLFVAGVPLAGVLSGVVLVLCIAQIGPTFVLLPAVVWLYGRGDATWGTVLLIWSIAVIPLDNILRPILIKRGAPLPLLLVFAGVIGGLVSLGIIGIFVGPVVLAVANSLIRTWVGDGNGPAAQENAVPAAAEAAR